MDKLVMD